MPFSGLFATSAFHWSPYTSGSLSTYCFWPPRRHSLLKGTFSFWYLFKKHLSLEWHVYEAKQRGASSSCRHSLWTKSFVDRVQSHFRHTCLLHQELLVRLVERSALCVHSGLNYCLWTRKGASSWEVQRGKKVKVNLGVNRTNLCPKIKAHPNSTPLLGTRLSVY